MMLFRNVLSSNVIILLSQNPYNKNRSTYFDSKNKTVDGSLCPTENRPH